MTPIRPEKLPEGMEGEIVGGEFYPEILQVMTTGFCRKDDECMAAIGWKFHIASPLDGQILLTFTWHPTPEMINAKP
jgi:hypothetical protein